MKKSTWTLQGIDLRSREDLKIIEVIYWQTSEKDLDKRVSQLITFQHIQMKYLYALLSYKVTCTW